MIIKKKNNNIMHSKSVNIYFLCILFVIISVFVSLNAFNNRPETGIYKFVYFMPLFFAVFSILFFKVYTNITVVSGMILAFMFIRYTVSVLMLTMDGFPKGIYAITYNEEYVTEALYLMIYEMLILFIGLLIISKKKQPLITEEIYANRLLTKTNFSKLNLLIVFLIIITFGMFLVWPALFKNYSFIINSSLDSMTSDLIRSQSGMPSGMRWIGYTCGEAVRNILVEFIVLWCYKRYVVNGKSRYWYLSLLSVCVNALITTSRLMVGLFTAIVFIEQIYYLYPKKRKVLINVGAILGSILVIAVALTYLSNAMVYQARSQLIQGYTNGYYNVYQSLCAYSNASQTFFDKVEMFFLGDGLGNVNVLSMFINGTNSSDLYNNYIYGFSFNGGAVVPLISQSSYYLSPILAPIVSFLCVLGAKKYEIKWKRAEGNILVNGIMSITLAAIPFMYNWSTLIHILTIVIIPIWFCYKINSRIRT